MAGQRQPVRPLPPRWALALLALLTSLVGVSGIGPQHSFAATPPVAALDWRMPDRFGHDLNADGVIDDVLPPLAFLFPNAWPVTLDACASSGGDSPITAYVWSISGPGIPGSATSTQTACAFVFPFPQEGAYSTSLTVQTQSGQTATQSATVTVTDWLIFSLGDSVASGEGNPDIPANLRPGGEPFWQDQRCHRSATSGPAAAALFIERLDPHSSVTFVHLACSGATILEGLLGPYAGAEPPADGSLLPPQVNQVAGLFTAAAALGQPGRQIDALLVSIGANDVGFARLVGACILMEECYLHHSGRPEDLEAWKILQDGVSNLPGWYGQLNTALSTRLTGSLTPDKVFISEYFDLFRDDNGDYCDNLLGGVTRDESEWASSVVVPFLNYVMSLNAQAYGWNFVGNIASKFANQGYCAQQHAVVQLTESLVIQGDVRGSLHPNISGQIIYAVALYEAMVGRFAAMLPSFAHAIRPAEELRMAQGIASRGGRQ